MYAGTVVEHGPALEVYHHPFHPYTSGLLASVPRLDEPRKARLAPIEGQPPDMLCPPSGCPFQPRCQYSIPKCITDRPALAELAPAHFSACWVASNGEMPWQKT
jgi:peptide/nickel transport system ATP-binding protein/oligopeptide transport system ATP-binding protein